MQQQVVVIERRRCAICGRKTLEPHAHAISVAGVRLEVCGFDCADEGRRARPS